MRLHLDIGSTYIKLLSGVDCQVWKTKSYLNDGMLVELPKEVRELLDDAKEKVSVSGSLLGGLKTILICRSQTFSGGLVEQHLRNAGCNIVEALEFSYFADKDISGRLSKIYGRERFDLIVIVSGAEVLDSLSLAIFNFDYENFFSVNGMSGVKIAYGGNASAVGAEFLVRPFDFAIRSRLKFCDAASFDEITKLFSSLIVGRKLMSIKQLSGFPITPTPAVTYRSFERYLYSNSHRVKSIIVADIGGATTDLFVGTKVDVLDQWTLNRQILPFAGLAENRAKLIGYLSKNTRWLAYLKPESIIWNRFETQLMVSKMGCSVDWTDEMLSIASVLCGLDWLARGGFWGNVDATRVLITAGGANAISSLDAFRSSILDGIEVILDRDYSLLGCWNER